MEMLEQCGVRKLRRRRRYLKFEAPRSCRGDRRIGIYPADNFVCAATGISSTACPGSRSGDGGRPETFRTCWRRTHILFLNAISSPLKPWA